MRVLFLDTETTGIPAADHEPLQVAIIDAAGTVLLNTLVRPVRHTRWDAAEAIHGISPEHVLQPHLPTLSELNPQIARLLAGSHVVIYNADYDTTILAGALALGPPERIECAMQAFSEFAGVRHEDSGRIRRQSLSKAAAHVLHPWNSGPAHSALADAQATRAVWRYLTQADHRRQVDEQRERLRTTNADAFLNLPDFHRKAA